MTPKFLMSCTPAEFFAALELPPIDLVGTADRIDGVQYCTETNPPRLDGPPLVHVYVRVVFADGSKKLFRFLSLDFSWVPIEE